MGNQTVNEGKTTAIISYFWVIGLIIAVIMNSSKKNHFASFHIRQMIGLALLSLLNGWVIYEYLGKMAGGIVAIILLVLWVIGFVGAIQGKEKSVPLLGDQFQDWFKSV